MSAVQGAGFAQDACEGFATVAPSGGLISAGGSGRPGVDAGGRGEAIGPAARRDGLAVHYLTNRAVAGLPGAKVLLS